MTPLILQPLFRFDCDGFTRYYPADDNISVMEVGGGMSNGAKFLSKCRVRKGLGRE